MSSLGFWRDLRYAIRGLIRDPVFTISSLLTLAIAIGATTAIFTAFKAVLLDPLPFENADKLVMLWEKSPNYSAHQCGIGTFKHWKRENTVFESIGYMANVSAPVDRTVWSSGNVRNFLLIFGDNAVRARGRHVGSELFDVLKIKPALGRGFEPEDDQHGNGRVAVITHEYWQRYHQGDKDILGLSVNVADKRGRKFTPYRIVGVNPPGLRFPPDADFWLSYSGLEQQNDTGFRPTCWVLGRLKDNVSLEKARPEMSLLQRRLHEQNPEAQEYLGSDVVVTPLVEQMTGWEGSVVLMMLLICVSFVLLIGCVNIAELLLARGSKRHKEVAIRAALGASPFRILRQLTTENVLLSIGGALLGVGIAVVICRYLPSLDIGQSLGVEQFRYNRLTDLKIDGFVLAFALIVAVLAAVIFGLAPLFQAMRVDVNETLKAEGRGGIGTRKSRLTRNCLLIAETVFAMILVSGAGLMVESLRNLLNVETGMKADSVVVAEVDMPMARRDYSGNKQQVTNQIVSEIVSIPGVKAACSTSGLPFVPSEWSTLVSVEGRANTESQLPEVFGRTFTPNVFETLGIEIVKGRDFTVFDTEETQKVTVVNEAFVETVFGDSDPIGRFILIGDPRERVDKAVFDNQRKEIIGVVRNVRSPRSKELVKPEFYVPHVQNYFWDGPEVGPLVMIRTNSEDAPEQYVSQIRDRVESGSARGKILVNLRTMKDILAESTAETRFATQLLGCFAVVAMLLAAVGFYGVFTHGINERRREVGIRLALGATPLKIVGMFVKESLIIAACGIAIGTAVAMAMARLMKSLLVDVSPLDFRIYLIVACVLLSVVLLSTLLASRSATRIQAAIALRDE